MRIIGQKIPKKKHRLLRPWNPGRTGYSNGICSNLSRNIDSWNLKPSKSEHQVSWLKMWMSKKVQKKKSPKSCFTRIASKCSKKLQKKHYAYSDQELGRTRSPVLHPARRHQSVLPPQGFPIRRWHGPFKPTPNVPFCIQQLKNIGQNSVYIYVSS